MHYSVAVFTKEGSEVREVLAPYQESDCGECPEKYMEFIDLTDKCKREYENRTVNAVKTPDGKYLWPWDDIFRVEGQWGYGTDTHKVPENSGYEEVNVPIREMYPTIKEFVVDYFGYEVSDDGRFGKWTNPNGQWDYYTIGGKWSDVIVTKDGRNCNSARVGDIDWDRMGDFGTYAVITEDGKWHSRREPVDFALIEEIQECNREWEENYDKFLENLDDDLVLTIVDCHH